MVIVKIFLYENTDYKKNREEALSSTLLDFYRLIYAVAA